MIRPAYLINPLLRTVITAVLLGLVFFGVLMAAALVLIRLNARYSPDVVWFPLPVTLLLVFAAFWAQRRWRIGLEPSPGAFAPRSYAIGLAVTVFGMAACAVQGKFSGFVRATELPGLAVSPLFEFSYTIYMAVFAAVLAELSFRGIMQSSMQTVLRLWPLVITLGLINVFAHRWGPEITQNGIGLFVILAAWTWLRAHTQSLWPPLILHATVNLCVALGLWHLGPLEHAAVPGNVVAVIAAIGLLGLAAAAWRRRSE